MRGSPVLPRQWKLQRRSRELIQMRHFNTHRKKDMWRRKRDKLRTGRGDKWQQRRRREIDWGKAEWMGRKKREMDWEHGGGAEGAGDGLIRVKGRGRNRSCGKNMPPGGWSSKITAGFRCSQEGVFLCYVKGWTHVGFWRSIAKVVLWIYCSHLKNTNHVNTSAVALWCLTCFSMLIHGVHDLLKSLQQVGNYLFSLSLPSAEEKQWKLCNAPLGHTGFPEAKWPGSTFSFPWVG